MTPINPLWTLLVTLLVGWAAYRIGYRNASIATRALNLSITKAGPRISSRVDLRTYAPALKPHVPGYAIHTTIYNDGDLVATNLEGEWTLKIAEGFKTLTKSIRIELLSSVRPWETNYELPGYAFQYEGRPEVVFQVDIDLVYHGLNDAPKQYRARYHYDRDQHCMIADELD